MEIERPKCRPARRLAGDRRGERFATDRFSLTAPGTGGPLAGALFARPASAPRAVRIMRLQAALASRTAAVMTDNLPHAKLCLSRSNSETAHHRRGSDGRDPASRLRGPTSTSSHAPSL